MKRSRTRLFRTGLDLLHFSQAHRFLASAVAGNGIIFTLHHVREGIPDAFSPNRILAITPEFLDAAIRRIRQNGIDIVSLDEAHRRLVAADGRRFACLTFDDGYRDNLEIAYPVLRRHDVPFAIYVTPCLPDGTAELWWMVLERAIAVHHQVELEIGGERLRLGCSALEEKYDAYEAIYWRLRAASEADLRAATRRFAARHGIDMAAMARELSLTWDEVAELSRDANVTIGAHTMTHPALAKLSSWQVEREISESRRVVGERIGEPPRHLAYPYGDAVSAGAREFEAARRAGFLTAVTTRPGVLFPEHGEHLTALPRVSLNGDYQSLRYLDLFLSGAPFALWNRFRRVNAA